MATEIFHEVDIDAPIEAVFEMLTTADGLLEWIAADAVIDPRPGGLIQWTHENGDTVRGEIVEIEPPRLLIITYGWVGNPSLKPGSTTVEIQLDQLEGWPGTRLRLTHRGLDDEAAVSHQDGWTYFLELLGGLFRSPVEQ